MVVEMKYYCCLLTLNNYANVVAENCAKEHVTRPAPYSTDEIPNFCFFFRASAALMLNRRSRKPPLERDNIRNDPLCIP